MKFASILLAILVTFTSTCLATVPNSSENSSLGVFRNYTHCIKKREAVHWCTANGCNTCVGATCQQTCKGFSCGECPTGSCCNSQNCNICYNKQCCSTRPCNSCVKKCKITCRDEIECRKSCVDQCFSTKSNAGNLKDNQEVIVYLNKIPYEGTVTFEEEDLPSKRQQRQPSKKGYTGGLIVLIDGEINERSKRNDITPVLEIIQPYSEEENATVLVHINGMAYNATIVKVGGPAHPSNTHSCNRPSCVQTSCSGNQCNQCPSGDCCDGRKCNVCHKQSCCKTVSCNTCFRKCRQQPPCRNTTCTAESCYKKCLHHHTQETGYIDNEDVKIFINTTNPVINRFNVTTVINITNVVNNTNVIDTPVYLNQTNFNHINITGSSEKAPLITQNQEQASNGCCLITHPRQCYPTNTYPYQRCFARRHRECSNLCSAKNVHLVHQQTPQNPYQCHYIRNYPYIYCGQYSFQNCDSCYSCKGGGRNNPNICSSQSGCNNLCRQTLYPYRQQPLQNNRILPQVPAQQQRPQSQQPMSVYQQPNLQNRYYFPIPPAYSEQLFFN